MQNFSVNKYSYLALILISALFYVYLGYGLDRQNFSGLLLSFIFCFAIYFYLISAKAKIQMSWIFFAGVFIRLIFIASEPVLSDDIYRFIWDGRLLSGGINSFEFRPNQIINSDIHIKGISHELYSKLNSKEYYSIYPPFSQLLFYLSTVFNVENLWVSMLIMRFGILMAEIGSMILLLKIIKILNNDPKNVLIYALNPLVIVELSGNLHFEAWLIFFLLLSIYFLLRQKLILSAVFFAMAVSTKLWPLMFLPLLFGKMRFKDLLKYYGLVFVFTLLFFLPLFDPILLKHLFSSIDLYFRSFEFNASIFYIARFIGIKITGYDPIQILGPLMGIITLVAILLLAWRKRNSSLEQFPIHLLFAFFIFLSLATTVHPWYITILVALSVFSHFRFSILWSFTIILSYFAYSQPDWKENPWLIAMEYGSVWVYLIWEIQHDRKKRTVLAE